MVSVKIFIHALHTLVDYIITIYDMNGSQASCGVSELHHCHVHVAIYSISKWIASFQEVHVPSSINWAVGQDND